MKDSNQEVTFDMSPSPQAIKQGYKPLQFSDRPPPDRIVRRLAQYILNNLKRDKKPLSIKKWRKEKRFPIRWEENNITKQIVISFDDLSEHLKLFRGINREVMEFPPMICRWLDSSVAGAPVFYAPKNGEDGSLTFTFPSNLGSNFPIVPMIDREGVAYSSLQLHLQSSLLRTWSGLIDDSHNLFSLGHPWLQDLFTYLNTTISIVEITLVQLYYKAKYDSQNMGWHFDEDRMGTSITGRVEDKFRWIGQITGNPLNDAFDLQQSFKLLRKIRNHINHFDPPCFAFTIEDIADWLSRLRDIGQLLWKIREKMDAPLSDNVISLALAPGVDAIPQDPGKRRHPQEKDMGYASSTFEKL